MSTQDKAPREFKGVDNFVRKGLIIVNTGDGKGKSTAAFGTAIRAIGRGYKVAMVQFIKGNWKTGEDKFFASIKDHFTIHVMGEGFTWDTKNYEQDVATARRAWDKCVELLNDDEYQLVVFDEINYVLDYNFLPVAEVVTALQKKPENKHVILTGRNAKPEIVELADLVTEMKAIKHPFDKGIPAQPGVEY